MLVRTGRAVLGGVASASETFLPPDILNFPGFRTEQIVRISEERVRRILSLNVA